MVKILRDLLRLLSVSLFKLQRHDLFGVLGSLRPLPLLDWWTDGAGQLLHRRASLVQPQSEIFPLVLKSVWRQN